MKKPFKISFWMGFVLFLLLILPVLWVILLKQGEHYSEKLPILYDRYLDPTTGDTIYHTIDDFKLVNQNGDSVTLNDFKGKILLVNFFFASCPEVCPQMNRNVQHIYREFLKDSSVFFLSHTVDPENDTPAVLLEYSKQFGAELPKWQFLTGSKAMLYDLAENSYKIPGAEDAVHGGFFHSENVVLIDKEGKVRGVFHGRKGMHKEGNPKIIDAVRALLFEYKKPENITK
jgi:protein SCO1/2